MHRFECVEHARFCQVVAISKAAVDRLSHKLAAVKGTGRPVDMAEEFRMLTLQVIGEAILSLPPEECDKARSFLVSDCRVWLRDGGGLRTDAWTSWHACGHTEGKPGLILHCERLYPGVVP